MRTRTLARLLQTPPSRLPKSQGCKELLTIEINPLRGDNRDRAILDVLARLDANLPRSVDDGVERWEIGWGELESKLGATAVSQDALRPQYFRYDVLRIFGNFVRTSDRSLEWLLYRELFAELAVRHLSAYRYLFDFGCGSGANAMYLSDRFHDKEIKGVDWSEASVGIIEKIRRSGRRNVSGGLFDLLSPNRFPLDVPANSAAITTHSLEQIGDSAEAFVDFLIERRFEFCLHIEPIFELYDRSSLFDELAARYHEKRNYLRGFLPYLQRLHVAGRIELLSVKRMPFSNMFHDAYTVVTWRPAT